MAKSPRRQAPPARRAGTKNPAAKRAAAGAASRRTKRPARRARASTAKKKARSGGPAPKAGTRGRPSPGPRAQKTRQAKGVTARPSQTSRSSTRARAQRPAPVRRRPAPPRPDELVPSPPSTLNREVAGASAARSGRRELMEHLGEHTETGPVMTGGDVDANWESAYSTGDEAPGGDQPTPDQDIVEQVGKAIGIEYQDNEELRGAEKVADRDRHRWELDPASAEDYDERMKRKP